MKQINLNGKDVLFVTMPKGAENFSVNSGSLFWTDEEGFLCTAIGLLPEGSWSILGKGDEVTDPEIIEALEGMEKETTLILVTNKK